MIIKLLIYRVWNNFSEISNGNELIFEVKSLTFLWKILISHILEDWFNSYLISD
jgi:hypothetical protein